MDGKANMMLLATHPDYTPATHPVEHARLYKYALIDTDAMYGLWYATLPLPAQEQRYFELDMVINHRGFGVDVEGAQAMEEVKDFANAQLDYELAVLTEGNVLAASEVAKIKTYALSMGEDMDDAGRETLKTLVGREDLPAHLREVLALRLDASRAPKKSQAILRAHTNGRMQHTTVYHGALSGRATARGAGGLQALNFARPRPGKEATDCEAYLAAAKRRDYVFLSAPENGPVLAALADAQRSLVQAKEGHLLVQADLSGIEARMASWLADDEEKLADFDNGVDGYIKAAMAIFNVEYHKVTDEQRQMAIFVEQIQEWYSAITKDQRQIGKVSDLALTFGGGDGAFVSMAANYGVHLPPEQVTEIVWNWRFARPRFERWWSMIEYAVLIALDQPGKRVAVPVGRGECSEVVFVRDARALRMELPSGRSISYHNARLSLEPGASAPTAIYDKPEGYVETLDRKILANNMTQGLARDYFWEILLSAERVEPVVHSVYDEALMEVPEDRAELRLAQFLDRMKAGTRWAPGLPLAAEGHVSRCWRK
jgi:DNA polymerase